MWKAIALIALLCLAHVQAGPHYGLWARGGQIINSSGQVVRLRGVNRSGTEFACIGGYGLFDGPVDDNSFSIIRNQWHANVVRIPLNEHCWLGINGVKSEYGGWNYQNAIVELVNRINRLDMNVILDLHWTNHGGNPAKS
jgi:endoglucanase